MHGEWFHKYIIESTYVCLRIEVHFVHTYSLNSHNCTLCVSHFPQILLKSNGMLTLFVFECQVWANVSPGVFWDCPVLINFWSPMIGLTVSVHLDAFSEILLIQLTSNLAGEISWGFAGLKPISDCVTFGNIIVSFGNIHGS